MIKKKEAIDILKNAIQYAMDEKEKNGILELIQLYEGQYENNNFNSEFEINGPNDSGNLQKMELSGNSKREDSEGKDNFS